MYTNVKINSRRINSFLSYWGNLIFLIKEIKSESVYFILVFTYIKYCPVI